ncbi:MAG TPA: TetR/AcrR family transcriptional regulator [Flavobacteriales bacterium]|nr:TetR/AcrR family transcriptional regulator [Flavobacteriales bacterium]HMR26703.1 TetR/AcrR family transcriptional regulator [Flavobacteriales bacterium]
MAEHKITNKGREKRERILSTALDLFNRYGIEYVGVREIAKALHLRPGHLTYYFADKERIVLAIGQGLAAANDAIYPNGEVRSLAEFFRRFNALLSNHVQYRCLLTSITRALERDPQMRRGYAARQEQRMNDLRACFRALVAAGELRRLTKAEEDHLVASCSLISRGWVVEAVASGYDPADRIPHYLGMLRMIVAVYKAGA